MLVASSEGGVEIEKTAEENPDAIIKVPLSVEEGLTPAIAADVAERMGFTPKCKAQVYIYIYTRPFTHRRNV